MSRISSRLSICDTAALVALLCSLGGCGAPTSLSGLRANPYKVYSLEVPADCETVYLRIVRRAQERYRHTDLATYQPGVAAKLAPDGQSATLTLFNAGGIGLRYQLTADLAAADSNRTGISLYCATKSSAQEALLWQKWAYTPLHAAKPDPNEAQ